MTETCSCQRLNAQVVATGATAVFVCSRCQPLPGPDRSAAQLIRDMEQAVATSAGQNGVPPPLRSEQRSTWVAPVSAAQAEFNATMRAAQHYSSGSGAMPVHGSAPVACEHVPAGFVGLCLNCRPKPAPIAGTPETMLDEALAHIRRAHALLGDIPGTATNRHMVDARLALILAEHSACRIADPRQPELKP